jgi:cyclopropane-fatty-acyl-phospholipid synthase
MERTGLVVRHVEGFPEDYARTLSYWIESFEARYDEAVRVAGAERARVWRVYLRAARSGFVTGYASVYQVLARKPTGARYQAPAGGDQAGEYF